MHNTYSVKSAIFKQTPNLSTEYIRSYWQRKHMVGLDVSMRSGLVLKCIPSVSS